MGSRLKNQNFGDVILECGGPKTCQYGWEWIAIPILAPQTPWKENEVLFQNAKIFTQSFDFPNACLWGCIGMPLDINQRLILPHSRHSFYAKDCNWIRQRGTNSTNIECYEKNATMLGIESSPLCLHSSPGFWAQTFVSGTGYKAVQICEKPADPWSSPHKRMTRIICRAPEQTS